jgi:hypothetical protein
MSLNLHPECKKRIIEILSEQLPNVRIRNKMFLEIESAYDGLSIAEQALPQNIKNQLEQYISENPLFNFIYKTLSRELYETQKYDPKIHLVKLTEIEGYQDPTAVAARLVESFDSLPWEYFLTIEFENDFGELFCKAIKQYSICDSIRLATAGQGLKDNFPLQSGIEARGSLSSGGILGSALGTLPVITPQEWEENTTYFQVRVSGFIGKYGGTVPIEDAVSTLKSFCGLSIALRLLKVNCKCKTIASKSRFFIHRNIEDKWVMEGIHELEDSISETFNKLVLHNVNGSLDAEKKRVQRIRERLDLIKCVFSNDKEKAKKILLAGQWLFDSYCGKNELLSFVQATVALEILLGEKSISDVMGLGELLRNRCAYLIGKSHKQREGILNDFKKIYNIRSKIVHLGKSKLNFKERLLFYKLQWMCRRVIQEEVGLLVKDIEKST